MATVTEVFHDVKSAVFEFGSYSYNEVTKSEGIISTVKNIGVAGLGVLSLTFDKVLNLVGIDVNKEEEKEEEKEIVEEVQNN